MGDSILTRKAIGGGVKLSIDGQQVKEKEINLKSYNKDVNCSTLPYNFYNGCAILYNNEIHILGGSGTTNSLQKHYKYNDSEWTEVSTLPYELTGGAPVVYNNEIHLFGTEKSSGNGITTHQKFNGSEWIEVDSTYRFPYNVVIYNNEIHGLGDYNHDNVYHCKWNGSEWTRLSDLPYAFFFGCSIVYNNEIHILGGTNNDNTRHYKWNGSEWSSVSTLPYEFKYGRACVLDNEIHIYGSSNSNISKNHYKYNGSEWVSVSTLPINFCGAFNNGGLVKIDNDVHIIDELSHYIIGCHFYKTI